MREGGRERGREGREGGREGGRDGRREGGREGGKNTHYTKEREHYSRRTVGSETLDYKFDRHSTT